MTKEEQLAYMVNKDKAIHDLTNYLKQVIPNWSIKEDLNKTAIEVTPEDILMSDFSHFFFSKPYHKCSYCKYGFKVATFSIGGNSIVPRQSMILGKAAKLITCPKCGNTDEYFEL